MSPIILYGSEVWGIYNTSEVDKLHLKFCKLILGVRPQTSNAAVFGELGRFPLSVLCKQRALNYYGKIMKNPQSIMYRVYQEQQNMFNAVNKNVWCNTVKKVLDNLGFGFVYLNMNDGVLNIDMPKIAQRLRDQYIQLWHDMLNNQPKMVYYTMFKQSFVYESYLDYVTNVKLRKQLSCFRLSSHSLEIERGRYMNIVRDDRKCKLCSLNVVESEYHFLLCCPVYPALRRKHNISFNWPNWLEFKKLLSCQNAIVMLLYCI